LLWLPGSPHTGTPLPPVLEAAIEHDVRVVTYARPGYGRSTRNPGRDVASAAGDAAAVLDALDLDRVVVAGYSGGGPHALACAALLPHRVIAAATLASPAPYTGDFDWFDGMAAPEALQEAFRGLAQRTEFAETAEFNPGQFVDSDWTALDGAWKSLGEDSQLAESHGPDGLIDDDVAFANPWGFELGSITAPVLLVQGGLDLVIPPAHADWLSVHVPNAQLLPQPDAGHVAVLGALSEALDWLTATS
jgi:pimeloyl-ACP methyl ester carboxylesterase